MLICVTVLTKLLKILLFDVVLVIECCRKAESQCFVSMASDRLKQRQWNLEGQLQVHCPVHNAITTNVLIDFM